MSNLKIWDAVKSIDARSIKEGSRATQGRMSVDGLEMVRVFTAEFGPIGKNWDYEIVSDELIETVPMIGFEPLFELIHKLRLRLNINHGDGWRSFEQYGHTKVRYVAGRGGSSPYITFDDEYAKKSTTDALKKCLSLLGVAADIYSGALDDHNYAAEVQDKIEIKRAESASEERDKMIEEMKARIESSLDFIAKASDYAQAARTVKPNLVWFSHRAASNIKQISIPATRALATINAALDARKTAENAADIPPAPTKPIRPSDVQ
jgi:hypothetical protein